MKSFTYTLTDPQGIHARPAGLLAKAAAGYQSAITLEVNGAKSDITLAAPGGTADAKRLMAIMRLAAKAGMDVLVTCEGADEDAAAEGLQKFFQENL